MEIQREYFTATKRPDKKPYEPNVEGEEVLVEDAHIDMRTQIKSFKAAGLAYKVWQASVSDEAAVK